MRSLLPRDGIPHFGNQIVVAVRALVVTSNDAGMFFSDKRRAIVDYRTFRAILEHFNQRLYDLGLVGDQAYSDSTLLKAHVDETHLSPTSLTAEEFMKKTIKENDIYLEPIPASGGVPLYIIH